MHAVLVSVTINDEEGARARLRDVVLPMVKEAPGAKAGYWLEPVDGNGSSIVIFESQEAAENAAKQVTAEGGAVTIDSVTVREVVAGF
jgi:hypothetical protein